MYLLVSAGHLSDYVTHIQQIRRELGTGKLTN